MAETPYAGKEIVTSHLSGSQASQKQSQAAIGVL